MLFRHDRPDSSKALEQVARDFGRGAAAYDVRWARYNLATHLATLQRIDLSGHERVLDVGCGTGEFERHLICRWPGLSLVGVDLCAGMLARARSKFADRLPLEFVQASAESLPFESGAFDIVVSCSAFHFIPDRHAALREMARVLRPGGHLVLTDWSADFLTCRLLDWWLVLTNRAAHSGCLGTEECERLLDGAGLRKLAMDTFRVGGFWGLMTVMARKPSAGEPHSGPRFQAVCQERNPGRDAGKAGG